ncbi:precorrin-6y C5,15-methyltransferase (decarboxylating) subunit CbiE [Sciscionella marina]|uniref:precorrin-6y C5,15-methyltransferase (decarboxylating) subunit CbiE n=1 Tax=Sciscionella marina TaxID=508770 RepID=UPI000360AA36|nr:precorrin-6y C5,15-methyltransferase (decarboxylating) subunit CbiE [Sciscionella marina]
MHDSQPVTVVGIGADGWSGLAPASAEAIRAAGVVLGGERQLGLLPAEVRARRVAWPSPLLPALPGLLREHAGSGLCVLASGDPMWYGIGARVIEALGTERVRVFPHPSAASLACARLGWAVQDVDCYSTLARPEFALLAGLAPGRRLLVLCADGRAPARIAALLDSHGYGESTLTALENLGAPTEASTRMRARDWSGNTGSLVTLAIECSAGPAHSRAPGLPDSAYDSDGQLTKRHVRAITVSSLAPLPGELLWDVGAGAGSIAIEWARTHSSCRAIAIERDPGRADRAERNAASLGVPGVDVVRGAAPDALAGLSTPDAVFIGGGLTAPGLLESCFAALGMGGRLVANAVTMESEQLLLGWHANHGGDLTRIEIARPAAVGGFSAWRSALPVTQLVVRKEEQ